jgi:glutamate synthase (ferredoxin)
MGKDCVSPSKHSSFSDVDSMLDFVELLADRTGVPVGIKSAVGDISFWSELAEQMRSSDRGVDYVAIDGGEGGTGAGPLVFTDHVALPFKIGFTRVYREFFQRDIHNDLVFIGAGKLGFPETAVVGFALGCDMVALAREPMMAIGCIQAQKCHTGHCPTGVATQNKWLMRGLDPTDKSARMANYMVALRKEILSVSRACGFQHPAFVTTQHCEIVDERFGSKSLDQVFGIEGKETWGLPSEQQLEATAKLMA